MKPKFSAGQPQRRDQAARQAALLEKFERVRAQTEALAAPLSPEDCMLQSMPDASPVKWHLAHTTWFFETFILEPAKRDFRPHNPRFRMLFNSYYVGVGERHARAERGLLSRPSLDEVVEYRNAIDAQTVRLLSGAALDAPLLDLIELGLNHEQQHQELILADLKHHFWRNPLLPAYRSDAGAAPARPDVAGRKRGLESVGRFATAAVRAPRIDRAEPYLFMRCEGGLVEVGHEAGEPGASDFAFDNETPRHKVWLEPFELGRRLVTNNEYLDFIADGGYRRPELWLSDGWDVRSAEDWQAPLYWLRGAAFGDATLETNEAVGSAAPAPYRLFTLDGVRPLDPNEPVCHVSYYEADAYARWADARLPTEFEWEAAANAAGGAKALAPSDGNFLESGRFHPRAAGKSSAGSGNRPAFAEADSGATDRIVQMAGELWQWTQSAYLPYPGFRPAAGAVGEYNGKFMINQMVLRGGSCATPRDHVRASYRNFFSPAARWQFSGIRLAR